MLLEKFSEQAYRAFYWISFSPDQRGEQTVQEFSQQLEEDLQELEKAGVSLEDRNSYQERYERNFSAWLSAKSRCASSMIAGPSKFPVERARKANISEQNHYEVWQEWRNRAKKSIIRKSQPAKTYESEIEQQEAKLEGLNKMQETFKEVNKIVKKKNLSALDKIEALGKFGYSLKAANEFLEPDFCGRVGFPAYMLQNNLANIKRVEARIEELKAKEAQKQAAPGGEKEIPFEGGVLILNYEIDRVQIAFPGKPAPEVISRLKSGGFHWAPSQNAWQRQLTGNGLYAASRFTGIAIDNLK